MGAWDWDKIGSGVKAGSTLFGMLGANTNQKRQYGQSKRLMALQNKYQMGLNQQGHDLQMDMWNKTNYGAQMRHMKDAGLNPGLMYGMGGGGGTTTGSQGGGSQSMGGVEQQKNMGIEGAMAMAQMELTKAQVEKTNAERDAILGKTPESVEKISNLKQDLQNKLETLRQQRLDNDLKEDKYNSEVIKAEAEASNEWLKANLTAATTKKTEQETEAIREKLVIAWKQLKINKDNADTGRYNAKTNQSNARINEYEARARVILQNAGLGIQQQNTVINGLGKLLK